MVFPLSILCLVLIKTKLICTEIVSFCSFSQVASLQNEINVIKKREVELKDKFESLKVEKT